jgi:diadenosine tetraphosphate (Ap4A) HIT family hydrolase
MAGVETEPLQQEDHIKTCNNSTIVLTKEHVLALPAQQSGFNHYMFGHFLAASSYVLDLVPSISNLVFGLILNFFKSSLYLDEKCPFCAIIRDEANAVTEIWHGPWDKDVIVFRPIDPASEEHWLVCPRQHVSGSSPAEVFARTAFQASEVAKQLGPDKHVNFQVNEGSYAGQTVFHQHWHVQKRSKNDGLPQFWDGQESGHYNTAGKPEHPEHVKPRLPRKSEGRIGVGMEDESGS